MISRTGKNMGKIMRVANIVATLELKQFGAVVTSKRYITYNTNFFVKQNAKHYL